jgi:hypothetical protein
MKTIIANTGAEKFKILYTYKLGGGVKGRFVKTGDMLTVIDKVYDINTVSYSTLETLHRLSADMVNQFFTQTEN